MYGAVGCASLGFSRWGAVLWWSFLVWRGLLWVLGLFGAQSSRNAALPCLIRGLNTRRFIVWVGRASASLVRRCGFFSFSVADARILGRCVVVKCLRCLCVAIDHQSVRSSVCGWLSCVIF